MTAILPERLESLFSELDDAVVVADADRRIVYVNAAAEKVFGYARGELVGASTALIYVSEDDYSRLGRERFSAEGHRAREKYRVYYRRRNGDAFASETVASTIYGEDGAVIGFLGIIRDISDRLAVEEAAVAAASALQDAIETIDDGFALYDADDRLAVCNERYREVYPRSAEIVVPGVRYEDILRHGLRAGDIDTGGEPEESWLEDRLRAHQRADGTRVEKHLADGRWVQTRERRTRQGGIVGIRTDITALKNAEMEIAATRRDRETLANSMPCLIEELDSEGRCVFINSVGARWLGTNSAAAVRQPTGQLFHAADQAKIRPYREAALAGTPAHGEEQLRFPDGRRRDVLLDYLPKTDADGRTVGTFVFIADVTEQKRVEQTLWRLHRIISSPGPDRDRKLDLIVEAGCAHFDLPTGVIGVIDGDSYTVSHAVTDEDRFSRGACFPLGRTYCAEMLRTRDVLAIENAADSPLLARECYDVFEFNTYIGAAIEVNGALHGAIFFACRECRAHAFTGSDRAIIKQLADWIGNEIARDCDIAALRGANDELERLANTDELTDILNRREFCRRAEVELARARRYEDPVSVLVIDVDRFKRINDRFGHGAGDEVLRELTRRIQSELRPTDILGRLGGEEFAVVLGHTGQKDALAVAERLRETARGEYSLLDGAGPVSVTISVGVADARPGDNAIADALARADRAMYSAKSAGRDRTRASAAAADRRARRETGAPQE